MKLELNFIKDRDGNPCVVISSPSLENGVVSELYCENFDMVQEVLLDPEASEEQIKGLLENIVTDISEKDPKENLSISVWRNKQENGKRHCGMMAMIEDGVGGFQSCSTIDLTNKEYKKFRKGSTMQKLDVAYHAFEEQIKSGIFDN